jgi:tRNA (guanine37-N1)-methyltransferase
MKFEIVTLFPDYFELSLKQSLIGKAADKKLFDIGITNLRDFATDKHRTTDATPYGGGGGMVMMLDPLDKCLASLGYQRTTDGGKLNENDRIVLTSAAGQVFGQQAAVAYSLIERMTIICGHYLGVDERLLGLYPVDEVSIGDFVLSGGEPAAAVMIDAVARLIPGVLGNFESALEDSHMETSTGAPCYSKPAEYAGLRVPEALLSGDHARIARHRKAEALTKCRRNRPDLIEKIERSEQD